MSSYDQTTRRDNPYYSDRDIDPDLRYRSGYGAPAYPAPPLGYYQRPPPDRHYYGHDRDQRPPPDRQYYDDVRDRRPPPDHRYYDDRDRRPPAHHYYDDDRDRRSPL